MGQSEVLNFLKTQRECGIDEYFCPKRIAKELNLGYRCVWYSLNKLWDSGYLDLSLIPTKNGILSMKRVFRYKKY